MSGSLMVTWRAQHDVFLSHWHSDCQAFTAVRAPCTPKHSMQCKTPRCYIIPAKKRRPAPHMPFSPSWLKSRWSSGYSTTAWHSQVTRSCPHCIADRHQNSVSARRAGPWCWRGVSDSAIQVL